MPTCYTYHGGKILVEQFSPLIQKRQPHRLGSGRLDAVVKSILAVMVYYGKLSKGCERCRLKKVRCDQRRPGCKRCEKSGTTCPGYRDLGQVMFRDESVRTIEKARRDAHVERFGVVQAERSQPQQTPVEQQMMASTAPSLEPSLSRSLQRPLGQMAADFFFNNFVVEGPILSDNNADFLVGIYRDHSDSAAFHAIEAVGLAGLSNVSRDYQLRFEAQKRYGQALARTNELLSDAHEATSDLTTMSVLLLGQYENVTVESWDQYNRLAVHIEGASALLKLRGEEQFERESGVRLYFAIRSQIVGASLPVSLVLDLFFNFTDWLP